MIGLVFWVLPVVVVLFFSVRFRSSGIKSQDSVTSALEIHKERLKVLEEQFQQGELAEDEYQSFKLEEEKSLLADAEHGKQALQQQSKLPLFWVPVFSVVLFGAAFLIYQQVGAADAVKVRSQFQQLQAAGADFDPQKVTEALTGYQALLSRHPDDIEGWFRLSRMQMDMQQFETAIVSLNHVLTELRKVDRNAEDEATILSYIGQSHLALNQMSEAMASFEESLQFYQLDAVLGLAGRIALEQSDFQKAIEYWTRLKLRNADANNEVIDDLIATAKQQLADQGIDFDAEQPLHIVVNIDLPKAWEGLPEEAVLFIYAREPGQRMPLAAKRVRVTGQKMAVMLSDTDSMGAMGGLSGREQVEVTARVSLTGIANTKPGDWIGTAEIVTLDQKKSETSISIKQP